MPQGNLPQGQWQRQPPQPYTQYPQPPYPQPGKDMMPPLKPRKKLWRNKLIYGGLIVLILLVIAGSYVRYKAIISTNNATPTPTVPLTFKDGTYQVSKTIKPGKSIKPDTYRTLKASSGCTYSRLKSLNGKPESIIVKYATDGPAIITILPTDKGFQSQHCGTWTNDLSHPITTDQTSFGDGIFIVNTDILAVIYRTLKPSSGCTYARLNSFDGTPDAIITQNTTDDPAIIAIQANDVGFQSQHCGTWTSDLSHPITQSKTSFDDGMFIVGTDILPGTYRIRQGSPKCTYARLSDFTGTHDSILGQNTTDGPAIITIQANDAGFQSQHCGKWTDDLSPLSDNQTSFGDGIYQVGKDKDILPGTYTNAGKSGCSYAILSGFGGSSDDITTSQKTDKATTVTIKSTDKGFQSNGCGTWTKQ